MAVPCCRLPLMCGFMRPLHNLQRRSRFVLQADARTLAVAGSYTLSPQGPTPKSCSSISAKAEPSLRAWRTQSAFSWIVPTASAGFERRRARISRLPANYDLPLCPDIASAPLACVFPGQWTAAEQMPPRKVVIVLSRQFRPKDCSKTPTR